MSSSPATKACSTARRLVGILRRVQERGAHADGLEGVDLVLHQGDERRDDDAGAVADERGHLVAERLAAAGRHQHEGVAAADHLVDDRAWLAAERVVAEDALQHVEGRGGATSRAGRGGGRGGVVTRRVYERHRRSADPAPPGGRASRGRAGEDRRSRRPVEAPSTSHRRRGVETTVTASACGVPSLGLDAREGAAAGTATMLLSTCATMPASRPPVRQVRGRRDAERGDVEHAPGVVVVREREADRGQHDRDDGRADPRAERLHPEAAEGELLPRGLQRHEQQDQHDRDDQGRRRRGCARARLRPLPRDRHREVSPTLRPMRTSPGRMQRASQRQRRRPTTLASGPESPEAEEAHGDDDGGQHHRDRAEGEEEDEGPRGVLLVVLPGREEGGRGGAGEAADEEEETPRYASRSA